MLVFLPLTPLTLYVFACGIGLLWLGTVPLTNGLVGQIFGMRYAAMLASIVFFGHQIGSFVGVWLAGYLYDTTGSYPGAFIASIGLGVFAALVNLPVNEKPLAERRAAAARVRRSAVAQVGRGGRRGLRLRGGLLRLSQAGHADRVRQPRPLLLTRRRRDNSAAVEASERCPATAARSARRPGPGSGCPDPAPP